MYPGIGLPVSGSAMGLTCGAFGYAPLNGSIAGRWESALEPDELDGAGEAGHCQL